MNMQHKIENQYLARFVSHPSGATSCPMRPSIDEILIMLYSLEETLGHYWCDDCYYSCPMHPEELEHNEGTKKCNCLYEKQSLLIEAIKWCLRDIEDKPKGVARLENWLELAKKDIVHLEKELERVKRMAFENAAVKNNLQTKIKELEHSLELSYEDDRLGVRVTAEMIKSYYSKQKKI